MTGLKDIAQEAGVSVATASRVMAKKSVVKAETRSRVLAAAERLGYRPNLLVRGMQTQRTQTIGVVTRKLNDFEGQILSGIAAAAQECQYVPLTVVYDSGNPDEEIQLIHQLIDRRVDGFIVVTQHNQLGLGRYNEVWDRDLPLVWVGKEMPGQRGDQIGSDNVTAGRLAADHLLNLGHTRLAHLGGSVGNSSAERRRDGFIDRIRNVLGHECPSIAVPDFVHGVEQARALLLASPRPTAIFAANDLLALSVYRVAHEMGLRVPADLSVVGLADLSFADLTGPPLTTVAQDAHAIGRGAFEQLRRRIDGNDPAGKRERVLVPTRLICRESTARVPLED